MQPNQNRLSYNHQYSSPGKVFLLGEYAVVAGKPALVAALGPRFGLRVSATAGAGSGAGDFPFAAGSPAGRLYARALSEAGVASEPVLGKARFEYSDPHQGRGGFGGSTAEYILTYKWLSETLGWADSRNRWESAWKLYRELTAGEPLPPSGADLVAQWRGGVSLFDPTDVYCADLWPISDWSGLLVFSAAGIPGRKVATHEHLSALKSLGELLVETLEGVLLEGVRGLREGDLGLFGRAMNEYADVLWDSGLENASAHADRLFARTLPGVAGVKGAGAMLSDSMVILLQPQVSDRVRADVVRAIESRGLVLISDGLLSEMGARAEMRVGGAA